MLLLLLRVVLSGRVRRSCRRARSLRLCTKGSPTPLCKVQSQFLYRSNLQSASSLTASDQSLPKIRKRIPASSRKRDRKVSKSGHRPDLGGGGSSMALARCRLADEDGRPLYMGRSLVVVLLLRSSLLRRGGRSGGGDDDSAASGRGAGGERLRSLSSCCCSC